MNLLPHQQVSLDFLNTKLNNNVGALLGDSAGTGKTLPALLSAREHTPANGLTLWTTLASAKLQLLTEVEKFNVGFKPIVLSGTKTERLNDIRAALKACDDTKPVLLIINYEQLLAHAGDFFELPIKVIVADECTRLGNQKNKTYKKLFWLAKVKAAKKIALSGTPITNTPLEAFALFEYLNPGRLGSWLGFALTYMEATPFSRVGAVRREKLGHLAARLQPYYLRREREVLLPDLPELMEVVVSVELSKEERKLYEQLVMELLLEIEKPKLDLIATPHTIANGIVKFARLRQVCVNSGLLGTGNLKTSKLEALSEFVGTLNGSKAIIFTEFASTVPAIMSKLPPHSAVSITGSVKQDDRAAILHLFQTDPKVKYLVGTKAMEMALNLQAADFVIHLDPPLTYSSYDQRISRARRQGRKDKVVSVKFIVKNSIEEKIYRLIERKKLISLLAMPYSELKKELLDD